MTIHNCSAFYLAIFAFFLSGSLQAEPSPYQIKKTHTLVIQSSKSDKTYDLYIRLPKGYHSGKKRYPVMVLNDTGYSIPTASGIVHLMEGRDIEEVILVGISYAHDEDPLISRTRDYTPTFVPNYKWGHSDEAQAQSGQSLKYIHFIKHDVLPLVEKTYRINPKKRIFVGHSYGGLLGNQILLTDPTLFQFYILGSPSLWYDDNVMFKLEQAYAKNHTHMKATVIMYSGTKEARIHSDLLQYEKVLRSRKYTGLDLTVSILDGATHYSAFALLLTDGLMRTIPKQK
ncbi:esterase [Pseudoalteromonas citrea]|uniref:Esterase n=1 Tax=Pseudoalteromonas citrea TaxID=43655 RepID=A0A5S3XN25_9GAMM|nr:alpha/beta hydrolase-fold protein [Pseudoalteromonas citrea]TMP40135.1 esterase [Pseudoalteromonas citrea]TMP56849.1 esterase [Pseudoalteromonas citrea]